MPLASSSLKRVRPICSNVSILAVPCDSGQCGFHHDRSEHWRDDDERYGYKKKKDVGKNKPILIIGIC